MGIPDTGTLVVFALGILVGGILFSPDFRVKFFKGLRHFLAGIGQGARRTNDQYSGRSSSCKSKETPSDKPEVQHIYRQVHTPRVCPMCEGRKTVPAKTIPLQEGAPGYKLRMVTCPICEGEGKVWD